MECGRINNNDDNDNVRMVTLVQLAEEKKDNSDVEARKVQRTGKGELV